MNTISPEQHQGRIDSFSPGIGALALHNLSQPDWLNTTAEPYERNAVEFAYCCEEEFARMLDQHQIPWRYKPRTFAVEWDEEGNFVDSFTPDFHLPALDLYVELVAPEYHGSAPKARKVRLLRQQYPEIRIELLSGASPFFCI